MHMHSTTTDAKLMASVVQIAMSTEGIAIVEMAKGPSNLHARSIRRILAFSTTGTISKPVSSSKEREPYFFVNCRSLQ
jgi:hypothetical protein